MTKVYSTGTSAAERLRRTERMADETSADDEELLSAASDLVAWGSPEPASRIMAILRGRTNKFDRELEALEALADEATGLAFSSVLLAKAIEDVDDPAADPARLVHAADSLVTWGALDEAERAIAKLEKYKNFRSVAANLRAVSKTLRASGIMEALASTDKNVEGFNRPREMMFGPGSGPPGTAIIVLTGAHRRFWVSLQVFYHLLKPRAEHIVFLSDQSNCCYLNGLASVAPSYGELLTYLRSALKERGVRQTRVMSTSAGGFMGLRIAADLPAAGFLGFGIRTTFSRNLRLANYDENARARCTDPSLLIDMRDYLAPRFAPAKVILYASQGTQFDLPHARHLADLPRVDVRLLQASGKHNTVPHLMSTGEFGPLLDEFFA